MTLQEFVEKWGFKLYNSVKGFDGENKEYRSKKYAIDFYSTEKGVSCFLLNRDKSHVLGVQPIVSGIFDEWDDYLSNN